MNNLYTITLFKLHNKFASRACRARRVERVEPVELDVSSVSRESSSSCRVCRAVLFDKLDTAKMHGARHVKRVESCHVETSQVEFGFYRNLTTVTLSHKTSHLSQTIALADCLTLLRYYYIKHIYYSKSHNVV